MEPRTFAAALTPLRDGGDALDDAAFEPYAAYLLEGGVDGILALGTTGEGMSLLRAERQRALELFIGAGVPAIAHCGAQTTADTVALSAHAAETGHPFIRSFEPGEDWFYSYDTKETYEGPDLAPPQHHPVDQGVPGPHGRVPSDWRLHVH